MKMYFKLLLLAIVATSTSLFATPIVDAETCTHAAMLLSFADTCLVKNEVSFDFPDVQFKKVKAIIDDKMAEGIEGTGKIIWENSPAADEYYLITLRKGKITFKYKGTVCVDKMIWENIEACKTELKKLLETK
jgi:hypothetical protein